MKALILAAGYGTRLYPYTRNFPKPLLKIDKRPIINYLLDKIEELNNISRIIVVTNDRFFNRFKVWKNSLNIRHAVSLLNDSTTSPQDRLGAIGDMYFAFNREKFIGDFLVLGGDNLFKDSLVDFIYFAQSKPDYVTVGLFDIKDKQEARRYGVVNLNKEDRIVDFIEKPPRPKSSLVAMCLYYFPRKKLQLIKEYLKDPSNSRDATGNYLSWLCRKDKVYGFKFSNFWFDIGHIHIYKEVSKKFTTL